MGRLYLSVHITAVFSNESLAKATLATLADIGIEQEMKLLTEVNETNDVFFHRLNQGSTIIELLINKEHWVVTYEVVCSFGGEIYFSSTDYEVINKMYHIPEETFEHDNANTKNNTTESGEIGYALDLLDDQAYIDPNIGLGNHDLLIPFIEEQNEENNV